MTTCTAWAVIPVHTTRALGGVCGDLWTGALVCECLLSKLPATHPDIEVEFVDTMGFAVFDSPMYFTKRSHLVEARKSPDENLRNTGLIFRLGDTAWGAQYQSGTGIEAIAEGLHKLLPLMKKIANDGIPKLVSTVRKAMPLVPLPCVACTRL